MPEERSDEALVLAARDGDDAAWGAIYDRYADRLHDYCHTILRDRHEAADAFHDAFIAATQHVHQLRDPSRLRSWLYAICRNESFRRARRRERVRPTDEVEDVIAPEIDPDRSAEQAELQAIVWAAADGLNPRDRAILDLSLRQGLDGQDLADALGVKVDHAYVMLSRLRDQVERSLGALLIARKGRDDCDELAAILKDWDGAFSPLVRKRVARHVDGCDICGARRGALVSPLSLLAAAPVVAAPRDLRDRVMSSIREGAPTAPMKVDHDGFPQTIGDPWRRRSAIGLVAAAVVIVLALLAGIAASDDDAETVAAGGGTLPTSPAQGSSTTAEPSSSSSSSTAAAPTSTTVGAGATTVTTLPVATSPTPAPDTTAPVFESVVSNRVQMQLECGSPDTARITAVVDDPDPASMTLYATLDGGPTESIAMTPSGRAWIGDVGPYEELPGDTVLRYFVRATDVAGNAADSRTRSITVFPCPG